MTKKLNITVIVSDIKNDELIRREYAGDYYDDEKMLEAIANQLEDADGYICEDCWNQGELDGAKCHCKLDR